MSVPVPFDLPVPVQLRASDERTVLVKYLKRASGSFAGLSASKRENVCFTGTGTGRLTMAPSYVGVILTLPHAFCMWVDNNALISGVMKDAKTSVCRTYLEWPSKYQFRTRLKSHPCDSLGCKFR